MFEDDDGIRAFFDDEYYLVDKFSLKMRKVPSLNIKIIETELLHDSNVGLKNIVVKLNAAQQHAKARG